MIRAYAIGDIHGHLDLLSEAHRRIAADRRRTGDHTAPVVHLGDYVDRGPESAEVIEFLAAGDTGPAPWVNIKGNHDYMFGLFIEDPGLTDPGLGRELGWMHPRVGGLTTLQSYGIADADRRAPADIVAELRARMPETHRRFLTNLPLSHRLPGLFFVHAGVRPGIALDAQDPHDMLWIRRDFHLARGDFGALIVHGHTPVETASLYGNRLNLDTGAAYGGPLTVVVIEDGRVQELAPDGRLPVAELPPGSH